jgi:hypothetical protein
MTAETAPSSTAPSSAETPVVVQTYRPGPRPVSGSGGAAFVTGVLDGDQGEELEQLSDGSWQLVAFIAAGGKRTRERKHTVTSAEAGRWLVVNRQIDGVPEALVAELAALEI